MRLLWSEQASRDLEALGDHIANRDRRAAQKVVRRITEATAHLSRHPYLGRPGRVLGTRELVVSGTSYIVPYRVSGSLCEVLAVFHSSREWPKVL